MHYLLILVLVLACACLLRLWLLLGAAHEIIRDTAKPVLEQLFAVLVNANDVTEKLEDAAGDVATVTEDLKSRERQGLWGLLK